MRFIVTLTSYGKRISNTAPYAIYSLLNQTIAPDKIIIWLSHYTPVPDILKKLVAFGLEIKFCEDIGPYTKLIPALEEFPNDILITADDDVFYPNNWLEQLQKAFLKDPTKIYVHRAHRILFEHKDGLMSYNKWLHCVGNMVDKSFIFPTGVGGVLYPPNTLHPICSNRDIFLSIAPTADDIWFWAMAQLKGSQYSIINEGYRHVVGVPLTDTGLWDINSQGQNDIQLKKILDRFPLVLKTLIKANNKFQRRLRKINEPSISVIMPCYNCEKYVEKALKSILDQVFVDFEFIIINDGSSDRSNDIIRKYLYDNRIKYISLDQNRGNYSARNIGMRLAKGKYIAVMDADDIAEKGRLLIQYEYLEKYKRVGCVGTQANSINEKDELFTRLNKPTDPDCLRLFLLKDNFTLHPSLMFRNDLIKKNGILYNEDLIYAADYDLVVRLSRVSKIVNIPDRLMNYRFHSSQISSLKADRQKMFADTVRLNQIDQFHIPMSEDEINVYQSLMSGDAMPDDKLKICNIVIKKIIESNHILKIYKSNYIKQFFNSLLTSSRMSH